ncbi:hypothetical protein MNBD_NITROSPINAE03-1179, partial [hydrothermal vent metagenome]
MFFIDLKKTSMFFLYLEKTFILSTFAEFILN